MKVVIDGVEYVPVVVRPDPGESLADCLRRGRARRGWTLDEAAARVGLSKTYLWELEAGKATDPSLRVADALCSAYRISLAHLAATLDRAPGREGYADAR